MTQETLSVRIARGTDAERLETFTVPAFENQTVLDVVSWVQQNADPTLSYRFACRVGMCGSCAMMVNGVPRWTCRTHISKVSEGNAVTITPLRNLPVIKDLVVDMDPFFDKWVAAEGVHHGALTRDDDIAPVDEATPARVEANAGIECINCSVCYAACDTVAGNADYLGPAALQRAWTLLNDAKDTGRAEILEAASGSGGCHNCHSMGSCTVYCPNDLDPMSAIAGLKRETARSFFGRKRRCWSLRLYMIQRITALLMAPLVIGHLAVMIYAVQGGLSAAEILGRTQGSVLWFLFYGTFVVAVAAHGAIGLRSIAHEWCGLKGRALDTGMWIVGLGLFALGARAVWAVTFATGGST